MVSCSDAKIQFSELLNFKDVCMVEAYRYFSTKVWKLTDPCLRFQPRWKNSQILIILRLFFHWFEDFSFCMQQTSKFRKIVGCISGLMKLLRNSVGLWFKNCKQFVLTKNRKKCWNAFDNQVCDFYSWGFRHVYHRLQPFSDLTITKILGFLLASLSCNFIQHVCNCINRLISNYVAPK